MRESRGKTFDHSENRVIIYHQGCLHSLFQTDVVRMTIRIIECAEKYLCMWEILFIKNKQK